MEEQPNLLVQAAVNIVGAGALVGVGALAAWYRRKGAAARAEIRPDPTRRAEVV